MYQVTGYIYILANPQTSEVFYVGRTFFPELRKHTHQKPKNFKLKTNVDRYARLLNIKPYFFVIEEIKFDKEGGELLLSIREKYWIHIYHDNGSPILNRVAVNTAPKDYITKERQSYFDKYCISIKEYKYEGYQETARPPIPCQLCYVYGMAKESRYRYLA